MSFREVEIRMDVERWASIPYYPHYEVSNYGRVRREGQRIMKHGKNSMGFWHVWMSEEGCLQSHQVHRLVAFAFVRKRDPDMAWVTFKDGNRDNLRADNLQWNLKPGRRGIGRAVLATEDPEERERKMRRLIRRLHVGGWKMETIMEQFELTEAQVLAYANGPLEPKEKPRTIEDRVRSLKNSNYRVETIARKLGVPMEDVVAILFENKELA